MSLIDKPLDTFVENQRRLVEKEVQHWHDFRENNPEGVYLPFWNHHREGQVLTRDNEVPEDQADSIRDYLNFPDVVEVEDDILVDIQALQIPFNCFWKSCRLTGSYCCISRGPSNTDQMVDLMQNSGRRAIDKFDSERRSEAIRSGDTNTETLQLMRQMDGLCVYGEEEVEEDPETGKEHEHVSCRLHELAIEEDLPLHDVLGFGPTLFPADVIQVDGKWLITAASERAKEWKATRWFVTSDTNPCTAVGDSKPFGILQNPSMDEMFRRFLGDSTMDTIQEEAYGETGPVEPEIQDGWIRPEERGLTENQHTCQSCEGSGCDDCDGRGWFKTWEL